MTCSHPSEDRQTSLRVIIAFMSVQDIFAKAKPVYCGNIHHFYEPGLIERTEKMMAAEVPQEFMDLLDEWDDK